MPRFWTRSLLPALGAALILSACAGRVPPPTTGPGAPASAVAVDRFLQLVREKNYVQMGWVFGTDRGAVIRRDPLPEVERRMYALARVLEHDSFVVGNGTPVPGRIGAAESFAVELRHGTNRYRVPFTVVLGPDRRWFVEQVGVESITNLR